MSKKMLYTAVIAALALPITAHAQSTTTQFRDGTIVFSTAYGSLTLNSDYGGGSTSTGSNTSFSTTTSPGTETWSGGGTVHPANLVAGAQYKPNPLTGSTRWSVYKGGYSVVIGNVDNSGSSPKYWFIHDIVGQPTAVAALPAGSFTYTGKTLWHDLNQEGDVSYTADFINHTGSGTISNMKGGSGITAWTGSGTLASATIALQSDGSVGVRNGSGTITTNNPLINLQWAISGVNPKYDLSFYGPHAEELAGAVRLSEGIGSFGIVGTR